MSKIMKIGGMKGPTSSNTKNIDTPFSFSKIIETHKDSISNLSSEDKEVLMALKPLNIRIKMDSSSTNPKAIYKLMYKFKELKNLNKHMQKTRLKRFNFW